MKLELKQNTFGGNALVVTLVTIATVAGFIALSLDLTSGIGRNVQRSTAMRQAINIGDAATEMGFASWRAICIANSASPAPSRKFFDSVNDPNVPDVVLPTPSPGNFPGVKNYTLRNFSVTPLAMTNGAAAPLAEPSPIADKNATPSKVMGPNPQNYSYYYLASADVIVPTMTSNNAASMTDRGNVVARVRRVLEKQRANKTDKAIDYKDDLEIHPGPTFVVNGAVHTNGNLYTGHNTLTLNGTTTYTGDWSVGFMPGDAQHNSDTPASPKWAAGRPPSQDQAEVPYGVDAPDYHKLIEPSLNTGDSLYPFAFSTPSTKATNGCGYTVAITIDDSNNVKIYNSSGTDITNKNGNNADGQTAALMKSAVTTNVSVTDNRQGGTTGNSSVRVATLDVGVIAAALKNPGNNYNKIDFSNPVIYIADTSAALTNPAQPYDPVTNPYDTNAQRGIRLKNGATLPDQGLTVASSNPIYIQGDYNTGRTAGNEPPSNTSPDSTNAPTANPASPEAAGYDRVPAAVIADAVTVLSNSWTEAKSPMSAATNTTVNTAIITGIVPSGNGYYSGGAENFPRFLEGWNGKTLTYYGSMIQLYTSEQAIGHWGSAGVYAAPNRAWYFDKNFLSAPPAGVPYDVDYRRSRWYMD
jgi:hypothetical protein